MASSGDTSPEGMWVNRIVVVLCACAVLGVAKCQAGVSYYGQQLHHPVLKDLYQQTRIDDAKETGKTVNTNGPAETEEADNREHFKKYFSSLVSQPEYQQKFYLQDALSHNERVKREIPEIPYYPEHKEEHVPIIGKDGVPLDTPEVQKAKEQHMIAHAEAKAREHYPHHHYEETEGYVAATGEHHHPHEYIPVIGKNGVPIDTPEVQFARKQHLAAHAAVKARQYEKIITEPKGSVEESFVEHPGGYEEEIPYEQQVEREAPLYFPEFKHGGYGSQE